MTTNLVISNKLLSLRGRMNITDDSGNIIYEAVGELSFFSPTWRITKGAREVATVQRKIFSFSPTWSISGELGEFLIRRRIFSLTRKYDVLDGPLNGASISGNIWDLSFVILNGSEVIARATGKILNLRDQHNIEIINSDKESELMTIISMITLHIDRSSENANNSFSNH
jgi:uncharacterized protein YxjI